MFRSGQKFYGPVGIGAFTSFTNVRSAKINGSGPAPAELASDPLEYFSKGAITVPMDKAFDGTLRAAASA
jgi:hypothetical protein